MLIYSFAKTKQKYYSAKFISLNYIDPNVNSILSTEQTQ